MSRLDIERQITQHKTSPMKNLTQGQKHRKMMEDLNETNYPSTQSEKEKKARTGIGSNRIAPKKKRK